jgi:hypothetical protein
MTIIESQPDNVTPVFEFLEDQDQILIRRSEVIAGLPNLTPAEVMTALEHLELTDWIFAIDPTDPDPQYRIPEGTLTKVDYTCSLCERITVDVNKDLRYYNGSWKGQHVSHLRVCTHCQERLAVPLIDFDDLTVHPDPWEEVPGYPVKDWQYEIANGDTRLGYREWRLHQKAASKGDPIDDSHG